MTKIDPRMRVGDKYGCWVVTKSTKYVISAISIFGCKGPARIELTLLIQKLSVSLKPLVVSKK